MMEDHRNGLTDSFLRYHFRDPSVTGSRRRRPVPSPSSRSSWTAQGNYLGWVLLTIAAVLLVVIVPLFRWIYVKASSSSQELVFQPLVILVGTLMSSVSFMCLCELHWRYGTRGIFFLNAHEDRPEEVDQTLSKAAMHGKIRMAKLFIPLLILYSAYRSWLYIYVSLDSLPFGFSKTTDVIIIAVSLGCSWIFKTAVYLYTCILFGEVCYSQESKMKLFSGVLDKDHDVEHYIHAYENILKCMKITSKRFRLFLAVTGGFTVCSLLFSLYQIVDDVRTGTGFLLCGDLLIWNIVNITGWLSCLRAASKVAHLHKRIVKAASSMHAISTIKEIKLLRTSTVSISDQISIDSRVDALSHFHVKWAARAAFVDYLNFNTAGISVYGFVLDRSFVHTSIGVLATTTWFVLGRSLS